MNQSLLQQAAEYYKAGHRTAAEKTIKEYIHQQPDDYQGWWGLANITDDDETRRKSLQKVLQLNPEHVKARQKLSAMGVNLATPSPASQPASPPVPPMTATPRAEARHQKKQTALTTRILRLTLFFLILAIAGAGVVYFVMTSGEPEVSQVVMAYDIRGENPSVTFGSDERMYIYIEVDNASGGVEVSTKWYHLESNGSRRLIHEDAREDISSWAAFAPPVPFIGWSSGNYEVEVYIDGELQETVTYQVQ